MPTRSQERLSKTMTERTRSDISSDVSDVVISEQTERQEEDLAQRRTLSRSRKVSGLPSLQTAWGTSMGMSQRGKTPELTTREDERDEIGASVATSAETEEGRGRTSADLGDDYKEQGGVEGPPAGYTRSPISVVTEYALADFAEQYKRGSSLASSTRSSMSQGSSFSGFSGRGSTGAGSSISSSGSEGRTQRLSSMLRKPNRSLAKEQALSEFSKTDEHLAYIRDEALKNQVELPIGLLITMKKEVLTVVQETAKEYKKTVGPHHRLTMDALQRVDELTEEIKRMGF
ncbi:uncharacterized protein LOC144913181 [Branchiostoma floridae x Branchiostoma belcheri]